MDEALICFQNWQDSNLLRHGINIALDSDSLGFVQKRKAKISTCYYMVPFELVVWRSNE